MQASDIVKPSIMNTLFKRYGNELPSPYLSIVVQNIKRKFPLDTEKKRMISIMNELPLNKKERASVKRKVTIQINRQQKMVDDYEKRYGEVKVDSPPNTYQHFESNWLKK